MLCAMVSVAVTPQKLTKYIRLAALFTTGALQRNDDLINYLHSAVNLVADFTIIIVDATHKIKACKKLGRGA